VRVGFNKMNGYGCANCRLISMYVLFMQVSKTFYFGSIHLVTITYKSNFTWKVPKYYNTDMHLQVIENNMIIKCGFFSTRRKSEYNFHFYECYRKVIVYTFSFHGFFFELVIKPLFEENEGRFTLWTMKSSHARGLFCVGRLHGTTSMVRVTKILVFMVHGPFTS
jgi:hypothetical protein